jgi:hypothetical protein
MLLVQGQHEIPSIADLLEGVPIKTRGYSHDYVPAWHVRWELVTGPDCALIKLFGGMNTVVHKRHWPALNALAKAARAGVFEADDRAAAMLKLIEYRPGITGEQIKKSLKLVGKVGTSAFQRDKTRLERWLCIEGREQEETEHHTHDSAWHPWSQGKVAAVGDGGMSPRDALSSLVTAVYGADAKLDKRALVKAFPVGRFVQDKPVV